MIEWDRERFRRMFPNLYREIEGEVKSIRLKDLSTDPWRGYQPSPEDFIARARSVEEAEEAISYLERVGEITRERAEELRDKLRREGLGAFGERRTPGFYFRKAKELRGEAGEGGGEAGDMRV